MQLLHVKLLTKFRGLPAGSEFRFDNTEPVEGRIEPICLVGLNGSGKSNLLELICEIFYYLDTYILAEGKPAKKFQTDFGFEISYKLDVSFELANRTKQKDLGKLSWEGIRDTVITFAKQPKDLPRTSLSSNNKTQVDESINPDIFILPNHIISYSSGQNELISNPFIKYSYKFFDILEKKQAKDINLELGLPRLFHLDYDSSQLATISNYLFSEQNEVSLLTHELKLDKEEPLDSFSIVIRFNNYRNNKIVYPRALQIAIDNLKSCATAIEETKKGDDVVKLKLAFFVNAELRRAFQRKFGSAIMLFRDLFYLNLMNIHLHEVTARNQIKDAPSMTYDNLAHLVPVPSRDKLVFDLQKVRFRKKGEAEPIKYKNLSDGEHQMMHVLGSLMLLNTSGSILLYDEPETHFNPEWRSQLISLINKATKEKIKTDKIRQQEILITSHSPFIVSDCRRERVFIFDKGKASNPKINTFGTSVNILTDEVFKKSESISQIPIDKIDEIKALPLNTLEQIQEAKEASRVLGESVEKVLLFRELLMKEEKLKTSND